MHRASYGSTPSATPLRTLLALGAVAALLAACAAPPPVPGGGGAYKVGTPYRVDGVWYTPTEDPLYDETGIASWYGPQFQGRRTANGEIFDMNDLTAAHRTLPMPSLVEVTNLENGRRVVLRVNDRGPFARGRLIDVSRRAAVLLGFEQRGTAKVRVRILARESAVLKSRALAAAGTPVVTAAGPAVPVTEEDLAPPPRRAAPPRPGSLSAVPVRPTRIYVQAGAFADAENARRLRGRLSALGEARVERVLVRGRPYYRVRVGPVESVEEGDGLLAAVVEAGAMGARLVVE